MWVSLVIDRYRDIEDFECVGHYKSLEVKVYYCLIPDIFSHNSYNALENKIYLEEFTQLRLNYILYIR